jgi:uncharacterized protein involved in outer membrane biogenesis
MTLEEVTCMVADWILEKKTGAIRLNFFQGNINNFNMETCGKSYKKKEEIKNGDNQNQSRGQGAVADARQSDGKSA